MDRTLDPVNIEAERSVLGSILIDHDVLSVVTTPAEAFYRDAHRTIYKAMRELYDNHCPVDYTLLAYELQKAGQLDQVGGYAYLTDLVSSTPTAMYATHYAKVVEDNYQLRRYIAMSAEGVKKAYANTPPAELNAWYAEQLRVITHGALPSNVTFWEDSFPKFQEMLDKKAEDIDSGVAGWPWPWEPWNHFFGDAQPGMAIYVAGATGMGKTTFAENIAEHWAKQGHRTVFVHLELNEEIMYARRAARHTGIDSRLILNKKLNREQREAVNRADKMMLSWDGGLQYYPAPGKSSEEICRELRKFVAMGKCEAFVIDYMQKVAASPNQLMRFRGSNADLKIDADHMEKFKNLAEELKLRCLVLGQLTKEGNGDISFNDLSIRMLRGTQEIADKVNGVALFHREIMTAGMVDDNGRQIMAPGAPSPVVRIKFAKNTLGQQGIGEQRMIPERFTVTDVERKVKA